VEFVLEIRRESRRHLGDRSLVDLGEALAAGLVERSNCFTIEPMRITLAGSVTVSCGISGASPDAPSGTSAGCCSRVIVINSP
jgi:hypothetical protein